MKILIVGGAGFVGTHLVRRCLEEPDNDVVVVDSLEPCLLSTTDHLQDVWNQIRFVQGDMRDEALMAELLRDRDVVFNCAAQTSHPMSLRNPLLDAEINCLGNLALLEAIRKHRPQAVVVYASTSTVVGRAREPIINEWSSERPLDIYSANKGAAEKYYYIYHRVHDLKTVALRLPNLYGPFGKHHADFGFVNYFIHLAQTGQEITLYGRGGQTRNLLYVEDAVEALYQAALCPDLIGDIFFAAHHEHLTVQQVAEQIVAVFDSGSLRHIDWPDQRRRIEIDNVQISSERLRALTGWQPRYSFEAGLWRTKAAQERMVAS